MDNSIIHALLDLLKPYIVDIVRESYSSVRDEQTECQLPERINVTQASDLTGYSKNSLYQMHSKGIIPGAHKVGGKLMFDTQTLRDWVKNGARR
jgi:predicted DNA-binding transcriptional regulator AlpA